MEMDTYQRVAHQQDHHSHNWRQHWPYPYPSGYYIGATAKEVFGMVQRDLGGEQNCRISSFDDAVPDGWYKVALMCSSTDYHFIRLTENGWYNKSGNDSQVGGCYIPEDMVNCNRWYACGEVEGQNYIFNLPGYPIYESPTGPIYFIVRIGWDKG